MRTVIKEKNIPKNLTVRFFHTVLKQERKERISNKVKGIQGFTNRDRKTNTDLL